jgi:hypothetical protein
MTVHLKESDIIHETTTLYSSDQNEVAEHLNQTIIKQIKTIITEFKLNKKL